MSTGFKEQGLSINVCVSVLICAVLFLCTTYFISKKAEYLPTPERTKILV